MDGICIHTSCIVVVSLLWLLIYITAVGIRFVFKQELSQNLGSDWYRLACEMGLPRTDVDSIEDRKDITLLGKIDAFLMTYQFPAFKNDEETTDFLVEALERASLSNNIAAAVRRDLNNALQREGTYIRLYATLCNPTVTKCMIQ